jgi:hypothetical protein
MHEETFEPLGVREGWTSEMGPYEGVPEHLKQSLLDWIGLVFYARWHSSTGWKSEFEYDLLQTAERRLKFSSGITRHSSQAAYLEDSKRLRKRLADDERLLLSMIDFVIWRKLGRANKHQLQAILTEGGSIYQVAETTGTPRLERRVEPHLEDVARTEMARGETPSDLLKVAWSSTLGRHPNPSEGYRNAVRAVEAAAIPVVLPNDIGATLGKVIGHLASTRDRWSFVLPQRRDGQPSVQTIIDTMGALWTSQYDRHVTQGVSLHIGQPEADAALPLAALLVHWLRTGALTRKN